MKRWLPFPFCFTVVVAAILAPAQPGVLPAWSNLSGATVQRTTSAKSPQRQRPNIVLIFPDNLGWGEVGVYGSVRGAPTPRIDRLAAEGMRLTNFNVEFSCTVSRAALLTGRYAVRTGAVQNSGITQWEVTIAEALKSAGYSTALFGKWHLGGANWLKNKRAPTDQGFDEWYGIPMTSNEAQTTTMPDFNPATMEAPYIWEGKAGEPSRKVKVFDLDSTSPRLRIRTLPGRPALVTSGMRWRTWTTTPAWCSTPSSDSGSNGIRLSSGALTMARRCGGPGAGLQVRGMVFTTL
jgi:Sulfatase